MLSVLIPSRERPGQAEDLAEAVNSVRAACGALDVEIIIGLDAGARAPDLDGSAHWRPSWAAGAGQAAALNAAASIAEGDLIGILEDDDRWEADFVRQAIVALGSAHFVSSTQLEVKRDGAVVRINDFPTPSGWMFRRSVWEAAGPFDESYRYHLDNEWLGRVNERRIPRVHLVEKTAPARTEDCFAVRPWLYQVSLAARLHRHHVWCPLVTRTVHEGSNMAQIAGSAEKSKASAAECRRLAERYGAIPW